MIACPACGSLVDPLRAPAAGVRNGKIVAYCSRVCAAAHESLPIAVAEQRPEASEPVGESAHARQRAAPQGDNDVHAPSVSPVVAEPAPPARDRAARLRTDDVFDESLRSPVWGAVAGPTPLPPVVSTKSIRAVTSLQTRARSRLSALVGISAVVVPLTLCGVAFAAYEWGYFGAVRGIHSPESVAEPQRPIDATPADAVSPSIDETRNAAREALRSALGADSLRIRRIAASALARTGDPEAIAVLVASIAKEPSDLAKLEIQYALARGGDARGLDGLVAALSGGRRDVRLEAARRLALLGDKRAIGTLSQFLDVSQLRLGVAEQLAYLAEPRAIQVLEAVRSDPKSTFEDKARAAIALGHAGKTEVVSTLRELLPNARFNAFAAASLARLRDPDSGAVRSLLVSQLIVASLRVGAARALRTLDPDLDPIPLVGPLVTHLRGRTDTEHVSAAEAVLILIGPAIWSERE